MTDAVSLKQHGLKADRLDCPDGGFHVVPEQAVLLAKIRGGGDVPCLACNQLVTLRRLDD